MPPPLRSQSLPLAENPPEVSIEAACNLWFNSLKANKPEILQALQLVLRLQNEESQITYIKTLLTPSLESEIGQFSEQSSQPSDYLHLFCLYLLNLAKSTREPNNVGLKKVERVKPTQLFTADPFDYSTSLKADPANIISIPEVDEKMKEVDEKISRILAHIENAREALEALEGKEVVLTIGNLGCGKSTTINYLLNCPIVEETSSIGSARLGVKNPFAPVGHDLESVTSIPTGYPIEGEDLVICDTPGFLDSRGSEISIANAVNIRSIAGKVKSMRIFLLMPHSTLEEARAHGSKQAFNILKDFLGCEKEKLNAHMTSIAFGITRVDKKQLSFLEGIRNMVKEISSMEGWNVGAHLSQIILIDPLEREGALKRAELLACLKNLDPITTLEGLFTASLRPEDMQLIQSIAQRITVQIQQHWEEENFEGIVSEYFKLKHMECIQHPSVIQAISELHTKIANQITTIEQKLLDIAKIDQGAERVQAKRLFQKFEQCGRLRACFTPHEHILDKRITEVADKLEKIELGLQKAVDTRIQETLTLHIQSLESSLDQLMKEPNSPWSRWMVHESMSYQEALQLLIQSGQIEEGKNLQYLLEQIQRELQNRTLKFSFPRHDNLAKIRQSAELKIANVFINKCFEGRLIACKRQFDQAYQGLFTAIRQVTLDYCEPLSQKLLTFEELSRLSNYGFNSQCISELTQCLAQIKKYSKGPWEEEERIEKLLTEIFQQAQKADTEQRTKRSVEKIHRLLGSSLDQQTASQLNDEFGQLKALNPGHCRDCFRLAQKKLIEDPFNELDRVLKEDSNDYQQKVQNIIQKLAVVQLIPHCFNGDEAASLLRTAHSEITQSENEKRRGQLTEFNRLLPQLFEIAKDRIKNYALKNYNEVGALFEKNTDGEILLQELQKNEQELTAFVSLLGSLKKTIKAEKTHYYFAPDQQLVKLEQTQREQLAQYLSFIKTMVNLLGVRDSVNQLLAQLEQEAVAIITSRPKILMAHGVSLRAGFSDAIIKQLDNTRDWLKTGQEYLTLELSENAPLYTEAQELHRSISTQFEQGLSYWVKEAGRQDVQSVIDQLEAACANREFRAIVDEIPQMLSIIKEKDPQAYEKTRQHLSENLSGWQKFEDIQTILEAKNYSTIINMYYVLQKLIKTCPDLDIDMLKLEKALNHYVDHLFEKGSGEILREDINAPTYFEIEAVRYYFDFARAFISDNIRTQFFDDKIKELCSASQTAWSSWMNKLPNLDDFDDVRKETALETIAFWWIKQCSIAIELSTINQFKKNSDLIFRKVPEKLIQQLGIKIKGFQSDIPHISAAAKRILSFPQFVNLLPFPVSADRTFSKVLDLLRVDQTCRPALQLNQKKLTDAASLFEQTYSSYLTRMIDPQQQFNISDHAREGLTLPNS